MIILFILIAILVVLALVLAFNTMKSIKNARKLTEFKPFYNDDEIMNYALRLQKMIQCKTVSVQDSYDDTEFARLRCVMVELFQTLHKTAEKMTFGDDCWIYKIKGQDETRNIMLMSHHDVVDVSGEWEHDGFSGEIVDGKIWGRGTVDTKTPLFAEFSAIEELLNEGFQPPCNIWIGSSHNEELGGNGIPLANEYFKENNIKFEVILDEGGALIEPPLAGMCADKCGMVAVHEKGRIYLKCTATAGNAHASLTAGAQATTVERMSAFINEIMSTDIFIRKINPQVEAMFKHMAPYLAFPMNMLLSNLWLFGGIIKKVMPKINAQAGGLIGTTCTFNNIEGSTKDKICTAKAFLRPVNEEDFEKDLEAFKEIAKKYDITVEMTEDSEYHGPADMSKPPFQYTMNCIGEIFPQYPASPFILPAGTDARTLTDVCDCVLRFAPIRLSAQQLGSVHAENENLDIDSVANCVAFYKHFIKNYK
ncbi:MAG: M20/M25/M40 family metallo-hydrolase [Clostridia bacterium]|nr:M20/M25/M40 family metallo-hydrolase [Clostridia bacterium]